jgi:hypothetical protein
MTKPNLTDEDYSDLAKLVREAIGAEPYPYRAAHQEIARAAGKAWRAQRCQNCLLILLGLNPKHSLKGMPHWNQDPTRRPPSDAVRHGAER